MPESLAELPKGEEGVTFFNRQMTAYWKQVLTILRAVPGIRKFVVADNVMSGVTIDRIRRVSSQSREVT